MTNIGECFSYFFVYMCSREEDTEVSIQKHWKNMKSKNSKFTRPFTFPQFNPALHVPRSPGLPRDRKSVEERRAAAAVVHAANCTAAEGYFNNCVSLLKELKEKEVLVRSGETEDTTEIIKEAKDARENIRTNRLLRYEEMSKRDEEFQDTSLSAMKELTTAVRNNQLQMDTIVSLYERMVQVEEKKFAFMQDQHTVVEFQVNNKN
jgi:hypothetical protein